MQTELSDRAAALRDAAIAELTERGAWEGSKMAAVLRYARALDLAWRCWEAVPKRGVLGRTDRGGQRIHPAIDAALKAEAAALHFGQVLGLEPQAAVRREGRPTGASSAPDRAAKLPTRLKAVK